MVASAYIITLPPTAHLLVGPVGVWVLMPRHQAGRITYDENKNRWRQKGGNFYLKIFAQENLGRPDLEIGIRNQCHIQLPRGSLRGGSTSGNPGCVSHDQ